ncbi:hypothetical protein J3R82DRAFT_1212 [Butyriboletus roseoflavus]|nr:hypothetical protein J3R82DRAFT_1212 [Butyriboletus roseoflavus]
MSVSTRPRLHRVTPWAQRSELFPPIGPDRDFIRGRNKRLPTLQRMSSTQVTPLPLSSHPRCPTPRSRSLEQVPPSAVVSYRGVLSHMVTEKRYLMFITGADKSWSLGCSACATWEQLNSKSPSPRRSRPILREHNVEVVISALAYGAIPAQRPIADAAKEAGVKLFVPSEYGMPTEGGKEGHLVIKSQLADYVKFLGIPVLRVYVRSRSSIFLKHWGDSSVLD